MSSGNPLVEAAHDVQSSCRDHDLGFCFIGGLAVLRWGEPRLTRDVDLTVLAPYGHEERVAAVLLERFSGRLADRTLEFARQHRVVLLQHDNGIPIDVALGALPFERRTVQRASAFELAGRSLVTCSAEDLVVHKVFAGRDHDWADVEGVIARGHGLDTEQVVDELRPLLAAKEQLGDLDRLGRMLAGG